MKLMLFVFVYVKLFIRVEMNALEITFVNTPKINSVALFVRVPENFSEFTGKGFGLIKLTTIISI